MDRIKFYSCCEFLLFCTLINAIQGEPENVVPPVKQYNQMNQTAEIIPQLNNLNNMTEGDNSLDFIIRLQLILNEQKLMPYLREEIYENHEKYNITTEDLIDLWKLREYKMEDLSRIIDFPDVLLTLGTFRVVLGIANLTFSDYFNEAKKNITNEQLQVAFRSLNISAGDLASAMTFGTEDQVYEMLSKGVYTWEVFDNIRNQTGWDIPTKTKDLVLDQFLSRSVSSVAMDLQKVPLMNKNTYESFWDGMNLNISDIYRVVNTRKIVDSIHENITKNTILGVAVSEHEILVLKKSMQNIQDYMDIITIYGESTESHHIYDNTRLSEGPSKNTSKLWTNSTIANMVGIIDKIENVTTTNCFYIDSNLVEHAVTSLNVTQSNVSIALNDGVVFNAGNPVICDGKLLGLASEEISEENVVLLETFLKSVDEKNGGARVCHMSYLYVFLLIILIAKYE